jgi:hypothetical protein
MSEDLERMQDLLDQLDAAYSGSAQPPPHYDSIVQADARLAAGLTQNQIDALREQVVGSVAGVATLGELLGARRAALGLELDDLSETLGWERHRLEALEQDALDVWELTPRDVARVLVRLRVRLLGPIAMPLRQSLDRVSDRTRGQPDPAAISAFIDEVESNLIAEAAAHHTW